MECTFLLWASTVADQAESDEDVSAFLHHISEIDYMSLAAEHTLAHSQTIADHPFLLSLQRNWTPLESL